MQRVFFFLVLAFFSDFSFAQTGDNEQLLSAIKENNFSKIKQLVESGANVNAADNNLATMLIWAAYKCDEQTVRYFVNKGANVKTKGVIYLNDEKTSYYGSLMGIAAGEGKLDVLKFLIEECKINTEDREYDPESKTESGWTALLWATYRDRPDMVKYLVERGVNMNATTIEGFTPLMLAAQTDHLSMCILLWQNKAEFDLKDKNGRTATDLAKENNNSRIVFFLDSPDDYKSIQNGTYFVELNKRVIELYNKEEYEKAIPVAKKAIKVNSYYSPEVYVASLNNLAAIYKKIGQYENAEPLYIQVLSIIKRVNGEDDPDYASSLNSLALLYHSMGQYGKAEPMFIEAIAIQKKTLGENHPDYASSLNNLALLYYSLGLYIKAEPLYIKSMAIRKKVLGINHSDYANSLNNLAGLYESMGQYKKAEPLFIQAIEINKKNLGETSPGYANNLNNLADLYNNMGLYEKAEPLFIQSKEIRKKALGENHPDYASSLINLGSLYQSKGQYEKAESLFIQAKEIKKKALGENHPDYAISLNKLALLYKSMGQYEKVEPLYNQVIEIRKRVLGESHPDYASSLNNLGAFYIEVGQYEKAELLFIKSKDIRKKALGEFHPDYAASLNNLAFLYNRKGQFEKSESLFIQSMEIDKKVLGEEHPDYATDLNNLALLYQDRHLYERAEPLFVQSKEIWKKAFGEDHPDYAASLNNLATLYNDMRQYEKAEPLFIEAKEIEKKVLGDSHPDYAGSLSNLALLYQSMGQYKKAEPLLAEEKRIEIKNLINIFNSLSEKEKGNYLANKISLNTSNNSFLYNYRNANPSFYKDNYNLQLLLKSLSLTDTKNALEAVRNNKDATIRNLFSEWQNDKINLSKQYSLPLSNRRSDLKNIETNTENLEKELSRKSSEFRNQQKTIRISLQDVQKNLQQDEVAIEFVSFTLYNKKWTDSIIYAAYILHKNDSVPQFVPLCEEKQLGKYFSPTGGAATIKSIYRSDPTDEDSKPAISGDSLYALIWKPLLPYLRGVKKINYSPAGLLYKVAFHALPAGDSTLLMDLYELNQYTSTRQLAITEEKKNTNASITLFGDCQFTMDSTMIVNKIPANEKANTLITASVFRSENSGGWKALSGTAAEIKNIQTLFDQNKIITASFSQSNATEEQFKSLSGNSPSIIHLATHGFFLPDPEKKKQEGFAADERNAFTVADDPLLRSGIVLSGANRVWGGQAPIAGREDGIVTAYEIAQMDLSKTDLVVLSACETALGDIKGNEGVFGLQRAFKLAGVKNMLLSLWKVPDAETAELMKDFYTYYLQGKTAREAFSSAQKDMRKKYKPYYWAAFVLIE